MAIVSTISKFQVNRDPTKIYSISADSIYYDSNTTLKQYLTNFVNVAVNEIVYQSGTLADYLEYLNNKIDNLDSEDIAHSGSTLKTYLDNLNTTQIHHGQYLLSDFLASIQGLGQITTDDILHHSSNLMTYLDTLSVDNVYYNPGVTLRTFLNSLVDPNFTVPAEYILKSSLQDENPFSTSFKYYYNYYTGSLFYSTEDVSSTSRRFVVVVPENFTEASRVSQVYTIYNNMTRVESITYVSPPPDDRIRTRTITDNQAVIVPSTNPPFITNPLPVPVGDYPSPRRFHTSEFVYNFFFVFGGDDGVIYHNLGDMYHYNYITSEFIKCKSYNIGRKEHTTAVYKNMVYCFGGYGAEGSNPTSYLNDLIYYDMFNDIWVPITPAGPNIPSPRMAHTTDVIGNYLYLFGGYNGNFLNDLWRYDFANNSWIMLTPTGDIPPARSEHFSFVKDNKLYIGGGRKVHQIYSDLWEYNPSSNSWNQIYDNCPIPIASATAHVYNNVLCIMFGITSTPSYSRSVIKYNFATNQFSTVELSSVSPRSDHSSAMFNNLIFVFGGYNGTYLDDMFVYNPSNDSVIMLRS